MRRECAWCGKPIDDKPPSPGETTSHGICLTCLAQVQGEFLRLRSSDAAGGAPRDRRSGQRRPCTLAASCRVPGSGDSFPAMVAELSAEGLRLLLDRPLAERSLVEVNPKAGGWPVPQMAQVVWSALSGGAWVVGCALAGRLSEPELQRCLDAGPAI